MKFKYYSKIRNNSQLEDIRELLRLCDTEFVPYLSSRSSTTQSNLLYSKNQADGIDAYFENIAEQSAIVALDGKRVIAFMSFKNDYICEHITQKYLPNLYVTTVIVHPKYRRQNIASKMYDVLISRFNKHYIFTRTWSTNLSHIRILISLGFHEHCVLCDDRGPDIDTNYYRLNPKKESVLQYIKQYRLSNSFTFSAMLFVFTAFFVVSWILSPESLYRELSLAIATSLMASLLCLVSDTLLKIRESKNDDYISSLKNYGIENLQFNKNELLEGIIPNCRDEIWISGCRLVMTAKPSFRNALITACKRSRNLHIKILATPPWTTAYQLIYGKEEVTLNYLRILRDLILCIERYNLDLEVRFSQKPLFSDTYKVDDRFITGPYLHCADKYNNRITAKDFFSLDITSPETELYKLFYGDYMTIWQEATAYLDIKLLANKLSGVEKLSALSEQQRTDLLLECCVAIENDKVLTAVGN